jgi:Ca-activated chloride channel family protein
MRARYAVWVAPVLVLALLAAAAGQAGRRMVPAGERAVSINVVATREGESSEAITARNIALYDSGIEQKIQSFSPDPSPARIVLLVDNSLSIRADVQKLAASLREFAYEIYEGDQLMIVAYDEKPEIIIDWTDDAKKIEASLKTLRKRGEPHLFDALMAVSRDALQPLKGSAHKRVIVLIGDGLDRGSKTRFAQALSELQAEDIAVYALQIPDRTGGAFRRDQPKAPEVIRQLTEGTGGRAFPITQPREAAKQICDELRKNRYILSYTPYNVAYGDERRLLVVADSGINVRFKAMHPAP